MLDKEGTIESPGYNDGQYPIERTCKWLIYGPKDSTVSLTFEDFALEESKKCDYYDYVRIQERCTGKSGLSGNLGGRSDGYCGTYMPPVINSTCNELHITFYSDDSDTAKGFRAKYRINKDTGKTN